MSRVDGEVVCTPRAGQRARTSSSIAVLGFGVIATITALGLQSPTLSRWVVVLAIGVLLAGIGITAPRHLLIILLCWLPLLGLLRRLFPESGDGTLGDPLLIVEPIAVFVLLAVVSRRGQTLPPTRLSRAVMVLQGCLLLSALNPLQGGPMIGLGGVLLVVVPTLAFWIGRELGDEQFFQRVIVLVAAIGLIGACYGLIQTYWGLPSWDQRWVDTKGYVALNVNGYTRAFGPFSAAGEYAQYIGIALIAWLSVRGRAARVVIVVGPAALLVLALWLEGSRGIIVTAIAAIGLVVAARFRVPFLITAVMGLIVLGAIPLVIQRITPITSANRNLAGAATSRQVEGLSDPFGEKSTLPGHIRLVGDGLIDALRLPTGRGVGSVTLAAGRYSGRQALTEADPSNMAVAAGVVGIAAYAAVTFYAFTMAWRQVNRRPSVPAMFTLGALVVTILQWLTGGNYSTMLLLWFVVGVLDRAFHPWNQADRVSSDRSFSAPLAADAQ